MPEMYRTGVETRTFSKLFDRGADIHEKEKPEVTLRFRAMSLKRWISVSPSGHRVLGLKKNPLRIQPTII